MTAKTVTNATCVPRNGTEFLPARKDSWPSEEEFSGTWQGGRATSLRDEIDYALAEE
jgi:hypothetical protein